MAASGSMSSPIEALEHLCNKFRISIEVSDHQFLNNKTYYPAVRLTVDNSSVDLYIIDE